MTEESLYSFSCPVCQAELSLPLSQAGISGPCPFCRQTITAPIPKPGTVPVPRSQANARGGKRAKPAPVRMDSAPVPQAQARTRPAAAHGAVVTKEEPEEDPGAQRATRLMGLIGALAAIGAGAAGVIAWQKLGNKDAASDGTTVAGQAGPTAVTAQQGAEPAPGETDPEPAQKTQGATAAEISPAPLPAAENASANPGPAPASDGTGAIAKAGEVQKDPTTPTTPVAPTEPGDAQTTAPAPDKAGMPDPTEPAPAEGAGDVASSPEAPAPAPAADAPEAGIGAPAMEPGTASPAGENVPPAPPAAIPEEKPYVRQVPPPNPEDPAIILREPREALLAFLKAKDWQTRLKYSLRPEQIRAEMEAYYKEPENKDGPVDAKIDYLTSDFTEDTRTPMWFFNVLTEDGAPIPVALEQTKSGIRVDWRGFIEGYNRRLAKFCAKPGPGRGTFYVAASRAHWFGGKVGDDTSMACFKLYPPTADENFLALVDTRTPLWEEKFVATGRASWDVQSRMIVTLEWAKSGSTDYLRLVDIKADSWRADARESAPKSPEGNPASKPE